MMLVNDVSELDAGDRRQARRGWGRPSGPPAASCASVPSAVQVGLDRVRRARRCCCSRRRTDHALDAAALAQISRGERRHRDRRRAQTARRRSSRSAEDRRQAPAGRDRADLRRRLERRRQPGRRRRAQAKPQHIPIYTVSIGTAARDDPVKRDGADGHRAGAGRADSSSRRSRRPRAGGAFTRGRRRRVSAIYAHLATRLGHRRSNSEITASFAGGGLVLLLLGGALSLLLVRPAHLA